MPQNPGIPVCPATPAPPQSGFAAPALQASRLLTTEEVARLLRVDPSSVRRWRTAQPPQGPPFIRLSERVVLYDAADVQQWLDQRRCPTGKAA